MDSLERLQGLHADLVAFTETRLANIDRLWQELEDSLEDFRKLLDKSSSTPADRDAYNTGKISVGEREYAVNDDFKHLCRALGTALDLEEVEAGKLLIRGYGSDISADQAFLAKAVSSFHDRRDLLLQSLRMTLHESLNLQLDESLRNGFQDAVGHILDIKTGPPSNGSRFMERCVTAMSEIEKWLVRIHDQIQSRSVLGEPRGPEFYATLEFQRDSLFKQHEAFGCILAYLFRGNYTISEDLRKLHNIVTRFDRLDFQLVHYLPGVAAAIDQYASPDGASTHDDAMALNNTFGTLKQDGPVSATRPFSALLSLLWAAQYSGWFRDRSDQDPADDRAKLAKTALDEDALEFLLSVCSNMAFDAWRHPARQEMVALLLNENQGLALEGEQTSFYFRLMMMECIEAFAEAWITNMPDTIRRLKNEEDDQRLLLITAMQDGIGPSAPRESMGRLHLETFLVLISFAFENRPAASELWWDDPDSNLYGFLHWAGKRQTVPRVSAFCEMLCSISEGPEGAAAAHKFLLEETAPAAPGRSNRRVPSMNYQQMFAELDLYAHKVHERSPTSQIPGVRKVLPTDMNELESPVMLSCYLRLLAHLCRQSFDTRDYIFNSSLLDFPRKLLLLSSGPVPTYLRASCFAALEALLTDKDWPRSSAMWKTLDQWASNGHDVLNSALVKPNQTPPPSLAALQNTLNSISISFEQYDAFIVLLRTLMTMAPGTSLEGQILPFPNDLGSSYRAAGIGPYVDFVSGQIFVKRIRELSDETQALLSSFHCLDLIATGLASFNEHYVTMLDRATGQGDAAQVSTTAVVYAQCHPFARLMHWILSTEMNRAVVKGLHVSLSNVESHGPDSPLVLNIQRSIDILNLALDLQPTYNDVVRPLVKDQFRDQQSNGSLSIEDNVVAHPELILDLCHYAASEHLPLALRSLSLLQKLSSTPKLNNHFLDSGAVGGGSRRIIDMLGPNGSTELMPVSATIASRLQIDVRELEDGHEASGYLLKDGIIAFFNACLQTQPELPNLAHLLLGFNRIGDRLTIAGAFDDGQSVFNAVVDLVQYYPDGEGGSFTSWLIHLKAASMQILRQLWSSRVSADLVTGQLRRYRFLQNQFANQATVSQTTIWDGSSILHPGFWFTTGAKALAEFLNYRSALYMYACHELRAASSDRLGTVLKQTLSTMLGKSPDIDGAQLNHASIFDLCDFMDLDLNTLIEMPPLQYFADIDLDAYMTEAGESTPILYDGPVIRELLQMYQVQLSRQQDQPQPARQTDEDPLTIEADNIMACLEARNRLMIASRERREALRNYADMVIALAECSPMDPAPKTQFILHMLQLILPKLDASILDESEETIELARAADSLLLALSQITQDRPGMDSIVTDKLFQLFRTCIEGIPMADSSIVLRATLYSICGQYLTRITVSTGTETDFDRKARSNSLDCVRSSGLRLISTLSDDAEDGIDGCRLNALILLGLLASLARSEKSSYIVETLSKANLLEIFIEPLKHITTDFQDTDPAHRQYLLSIFEIRMLLLLQVSRSREGARAILDAGLMPAVRDSMLFRADPDLGILPTPESTSLTATTTVSSTITTNPVTASAALHNYYTLLASTLRLLLSVLLSRGPQNEQAQFLARSFLQDYRPNMVGLFKKYAGVNGKVEERSRAVLGECVKSYTGLATLSGFVDFEDESTIEEMRESGFS